MSHSAHDMMIFELDAASEKARIAEARDRRLLKNQQRALENRAKEEERRRLAGEPPLPAATGRRLRRAYHQLCDQMGPQATSSRLGSRQKPLRVAPAESEATKEKLGRKSALQAPRSKARAKQRLLALEKRLAQMDLS